MPLFLLYLVVMFYFFILFQYGYRQLKRQQAELDLARSRDDFWVSMSHELRTPLTSIIGNSELLGEEVKDPELKALITSIERAGRTQLLLVNDILDMSKIESGKFTIDAMPFDLHRLLSDVESMFATAARDADLEWEVQPLQYEPYQLIGDRQRIAQILLNLVGNAIKFTDEGKVTLSAGREGGELVFRVEDSGIGMDATAVEQLFRRFEQAHGSVSHRFGGSGLGLYISKNLAEMMGGRIEVSSEEGVGSLFTLRLPYRASEEPVECELSQQMKVDHQTVSGCVLIAEDSPEMQLLERRMLEKMGVTVSIVNNGKEVLEAVGQQPFDLILMDMQMPEMDGVESTRQLRALGVTTPVIALTANVMPSHREQFSAAGCDGFLSKPIDRQALERTVRSFLQSE